jgi:hypothetical protein
MGLRLPYRHRRWEPVLHVRIVASGEIRGHVECRGVGFRWVELFYVHSTSQVLLGCGWHRHSCRCKKEYDKGENVDHHVRVASGHFVCGPICGWILGS